MKLYTIFVTLGLIFSVPMFNQSSDTDLLREELMASRQTITELQTRMDSITSKVDDNSKAVESIFVFPLKDTRVEVTSPFAWRRDPITGETKHHQGSDFVSYIDTAQVVAPKTGVVEKSGWISNTAGLGVWLNVDNSTQLRFYHMSQLNVREGDTVSVGTVLGNMGNTGKSTGPHLHYEMWTDGKLVDVTNVVYRHPLALN